MPYFFISRHIVVRLTCSSRAAAPISPPCRASVADDRLPVGALARRRHRAFGRRRRRRRDNLLRQILGSEARAPRDRDRALDDVFELTDVARDKS